MTSRYLDCHLVEGVWYMYDWDTKSSMLIYGKPDLLCPYVVYSMLIQGLGVILTIFSLANHAAGVPTVITHPEFSHMFFSEKKIPGGNSKVGGDL